MSRTIYITETDYERLTDLLQSGTAGSQRDNSNHHKLESELERAMIVDAKEIPRDVITMNSKAVLMDMDSKKEITHTLVFPSQADSAKNKISILAPIGMAMLGYRTGDIFEWKVPAGTRRMKIIKILYQPEAAGDYHL